MTLLGPCKCYICEDRLVELCYHPVLICMDCDARARSLFVLPILRQRLHMEPNPEMVMSIARFAGPCLHLRRRLFFLREVLLADNSYFHWFCDLSGCLGYISCNEEILDRILSFLGGIGDILQVHFDTRRNHPRTRNMYVTREDTCGRPR